MKYTKKEFEGNVAISMSDNEVRIWICKDGQSIFRIKAIGKVYKGETGVIVIGKSETIAKEGG
jgi:hypothetical protein